MAKSIRNKAIKNLRQQQLNHKKDPQQNKKNPTAENSKLLKKIKERNGTSLFFPAYGDVYVYFSSLLNDNWEQKNTLSQYIMQAYNQVGQNAQSMSDNFYSSAMNINTDATINTEIDSIYTGAYGLINILNKRAEQEAGVENKFLTLLQKNLMALGDTQLPQEIAIAIDNFTEGLKNGKMPLSVYQNLASAFDKLPTLNQRTNEIFDALKQTHNNNITTLNTLIEEAYKNNDQMQDKIDLAIQNNDRNYLRALTAQQLSETNTVLEERITDQLNIVFQQFLNELATNEDFMNLLIPFISTFENNNNNLSKRIKAFLLMHFIKNAQAIIKNPSITKTIINQFTTNFNENFIQPLLELTQQEVEAFSSQLESKKIKSLEQHILDGDGYIAASLVELKKTDPNAYQTLIKVIDDQDNGQTIAKLIDEMINTKNKQDQAKKARIITGKLQRKSGEYYQRLQAYVANNNKLIQYTPKDLFLNIQIAKGKALEMLVRENVLNLFDGVIVGGDADRKADVAGVYTIGIQVEAKKLNIDISPIQTGLTNIAKDLSELQVKYTKENNNNAIPIDVLSAMRAYEERTKKTIQLINTLDTELDNKQKLLNNLKELIIAEISVKDYKAFTTFGKGFGAGGVGGNVNRISENIIQLLSLVSDTMGKIDKDLITIAMLNCGTATIGNNNYKMGLQQILTAVAIDLFLDYGFTNIPKYFQQLEKNINSELNVTASLGASTLNLFVLNGYLYPASYLFIQLAEGIKDHLTHVSNSIQDVLSPKHVSISIRQPIAETDIPAVITESDAPTRWKMVKEKAEAIFSLKIDFGIGLIEAFNKLNTINFSNLS